MVRRFVNQLDEPSAVHWYGVRIANEMDGVAGLTQPPVEPGGEFLYDFTVPDAGTYWYHPIDKDGRQLGNGLYGALVVEEPEPPEVDFDEVLLLDDWPLLADGTRWDAYGSLSEVMHDGMVGSWITVNGRAAWNREVREHDRLRVRLVNVSGARTFTIGARSLQGWLVALDGQPLESVEPFEGVELAPGQRADLIVDVTARPGTEALLVGVEDPGTRTLATFVVTGVARLKPSERPAPLAPNPIPCVGTLYWNRDAVLRIAGGAMEERHEPTSRENELQYRDLWARNAVWTFNEQSGLSSEPAFRLSRGQSVKLMLWNRTRWKHPVHIHGHHFQLVKWKLGLGPHRDTLVLEPHQTCAVLFVADNPGQWLVRSPVPSRAGWGLKTWFEVT